MILRIPTPFVSVLGLALCLLALSTPGQAQTSTPHTVAKSCGTPGQAACPASPPNITPWMYYADPGWGQTFPPFYSLAEADAYHRSYFTSVRRFWCTDTLTSTVTDDGDVHQGVLAERYFTLYYDATRSLTSDANDCSIRFSTSMTVHAGRSYGCPAHLQFSYQANPPIGPSCGAPSQPKPNVQKEIGRSCNGGCASGSTSSNSGAASPGAGSTTIGDPINVSSGNNYREEVDYSGSGSNALRFVRSYNSLEGNYAATRGGVDSPEFIWSFVGAGWRASYFQSLTPVTINDTNGAHTSVYATRPDGQVLIFVLSGGVYTPDADVGDSLVQTTSGWSYQTQDDVIETYTSDGQLTSVTHRGQSPITVNYATPGAPPTSVSDAFGHTLQFTYGWDSSKHRVLTSVTDPAGHTIQYTYDTHDNLSTVTYPDGTSHVYGYGTSDTAHSLTTLTDEAGVVYASWNYSLGDKVTSSQLAGGVEAYSYAYSYAYLDMPNGTVTVTDPLGRSRNYGQSLMLGAYRMATADTPCPDCDASRAFDGNGNITSRTDFNGHTTTYVYDTLNNLEISRTEAAGTPQARTITTTWDPSWRQPDLITEPNRTTAFTYDPMGNVLTTTIKDTSVSPNVARTWTYTNDSYGRVLTAKGPRTDVDTTTTYTYYTCNTGFECGQLQTVTDAAGNVTTYDSYDAHGQPLSITDPNGTLTILVYDARMRLTSRTIGGETTNFAYYPTGLLQAVTIPDGSTVKYTYDAAHRLIQLADGAGNTLQYALDAMGNRVGESAYDPNNVLSRAMSRVYNTLNELSQTVGAAGTADVTTTYGYDTDGNPTSIAAPLARTTGQAYDALNRLSTLTDPNQGNTVFGYDANDNLVTVHDPLSLTTTYSYNGFGDQTGVISPSTGTTVNSYDSAGNLASSEDARGATAHYSYDALNRVTQIAYGDQTLAYAYDIGPHGRGRLTSASDSAHSLHWQYDALGRVLQKTQIVNNVNRSVGYGYSGGNLVTMTTPSGQSIAYTYSNHLISSISINGTPLLSNVSYEPFGPVRVWTWGNGTSESRLHDTDGNPQLFTGAESTSYTVDSASRIVGISNAVNPALTWNFGYDNLDRIAAAATPATSLGWAYDADGNRTSESGAPAPVYAASSLTLIYNNRGRLDSVTAPPNATTHYTYDALGQRIAKTSTTATTLFVYDEAGHLLGEYDGAGDLIEETVWMGDLPVATLQPNATGGVSVFYIHSDHLDTPKAITRPSDNLIVWRWDQDPYGVASPNQNPSNMGSFTFNLRFPGQYYDAETGLNYNMARDYDSTTGRYVESDPIGLDGGLNTYAYANGNPISIFDSLGLMGFGGGGSATQGSHAAANACSDDDHCEEQVLKDEAVCRSLPNSTDEQKAVRSRCWSSANERYGACRAKRPLPPLVTWRVAPVLPVPVPTPAPVPVVPIRPVLPPFMEPELIPIL
jgi:RHS repeat-associated protein